MLSACSPLEPAASEASNSEAYSMFALSLDNDSCRSPEAFGIPPTAERPRKKLYMPEQKPLTHFQVCPRLSITETPTRTKAAAQAGNIGRPMTYDASFLARPEMSCCMSSSMRISCVTQVPDGNNA